MTAKFKIELGNLQLIDKMKRQKNFASQIIQFKKSKIIICVSLLAVFTIMKKITSKTDTVLQRS